MRASCNVWYRRECLASKVLKMHRHMRYNIHEVIVMQKSATLNLRVDPEVKQSAESVLSQLGLSMSTAVDMFLRQVSLTGGIPFRVALPEAPRSVDVDAMTDR